MAGHLVLAVPIRCGAAEAREDDQRPEHPDDADHAPKDLPFVPLELRFIERLGEAVIERAGKVLFTAVEPAGLKKLFGANHPQRVEQLCADDVLPALAAIQ